ncbi:MAG: hypothetical protein Q8L14_14210 [Myxococcales bacterium]|nr:hypothetical protein [Myxococcales bacterium]
MRKFWIGLAGLGALAGGWALANAPADDAALEYAGTFEGAAPGSPVSVALYDSASGVSNALCGPIAATVSGSSFRALLPAQCAAAVRANAAIFVGVTVAGVAVPRVRLRAVPYAVEARRVTLSSPDGGVRTTVDGLFCGATANTTGALTSILGQGAGYRAAKALCQSACGQATAHMCSSLEVITSLELAITVPSGWMKAGVSTPSIFGGIGVVMSECNAWTVGTRDIGGNLYAASYWDETLFTYDYCNGMHAVLCCD